MPLLPYSVEIAFYRVWALIFSYIISPSSLNQHATSYIVYNVVTHVQTKAFADLQGERYGIKYF